MMTLRIGPRNGKSSDRRNGGFAAPVLPRSGDLLAAAVCPHCQRDLAEYRFTTDDGLPIITYHCLEHGDVIPLRGILARDHPITEEEN